MAGEFKAWLEKQGLTAEQKAEVEKAFNIEGLQSKLDTGVMAQDRFSRGMDDLRLKQEEAARKEAEIQAKWDRANAEYIAMQETVGATTSQLAAKEAEVEKLRKDLDAAKVDPTKVVTPDQLLNLRKQDAAALGNVMRDLMIVQMEHKQLFGAELPIGEFYDKWSTATDGKGLRDAWSEQYKVTEKRAEVAKAAHDKEIEDVRAEERKKVVAEMSNPATRTLKPSAQPFYTPEGKVKEGDSERSATGPWDESGPFEAESKLLQELETARYGT